MSFSSSWLLIFYFMFFYIINFFIFFALCDFFLYFFCRSWVLLVLNCVILYRKKYQKICIFLANLYIIYAHINKTASSRLYVYMLIYAGVFDTIKRGKGSQLDTIKRKDKDLPKR